MWVQLYVITAEKTVSAGLDEAHGRAAPGRGVWRGSPTTRAA